MFCKHCGNNITQANATFCNSCGKAVEGASPPAPPVPGAPRPAGAGIAGLPIHLERLVVVVASVIGLIGALLPWFRVSAFGLSESMPLGEQGQGWMRWIALALFVVIAGIALALGDRKQPLTVAVNNLPLHLLAIGAGAVNLIFAIVSFAVNNSDFNRELGGLGGLFGGVTFSFGITFGFVLTIIAALGLIAAPFVGKVIKK